MTTSNHETFHVIYDGPALATSRMDVRDLAPALVATADLFAAVNAEVNGNAAELRVEVKGSFKAGSFGIELICAQDLLQQIRDIFTSPTANALANASGILALVTAPVGGLIWLLRRLQGRPPRKIEIHGGTATLWITDSESVEVDHRVIKIWRSTQVRTSLEKTLSPLRREGITEFGIVRNEDIWLAIHADEVDWFDAHPSREATVVSDSTIRKVLLLESVVFKDGNKWRVNDGQYTFHATLNDHDFLARVNAGERFGKGDILIVDLQQTQTVMEGTLKTEYTITEVHEHKVLRQDCLL